MKKLLLIFSFLILPWQNCFAGILSPLADLYLTLELNKPILSSKAINSKFENRNDFFDNIRQFEDVAIGGNLRFGKFFGANINWSQTTLKNDSLSGVTTLENRAKFRSDQINYTGLFYVPIIPQRAQIFLEAGVVDIGSKLNYSILNGAKVERKSRQKLGLYGIGAQISPFGGDFIRLSLHRYTGRIGLLSTNYTSVRIGYLKSL